MLIYLSFLAILTSFSLDKAGLVLKTDRYHQFISNCTSRRASAEPIIVKISKVKGPEVEYLIKKGDTLSEIAQKYDKDMKEIAKDNTIKNLDLIYYDKTLILK